MAILNHEKKEVVFKLVYCGPALSGKTTNLRCMASQIDPTQRSDLYSIATSTDRTLYFDYFPPTAASLNGYRTKLQLYTAPGRIFYQATRQLVLRGVDGIVFVADSGREVLDDNLREFQTMEECVALNGATLDRIPLVLQYNKRDVENAIPLDQLESWLNRRERRLTSFEAVATRGHNVFATLGAVSQLVLHRFHQVVAASGSPRPAPSQIVSAPTPVSANGGGDARVETREPPGKATAPVLAV